MKPKNSQRQLLELYLLQSADEPVAVLNEVELLELSLYFVCPEEVRTAAPPYDWNFVVGMCFAFCVPGELAAGQADEITAMALRRVARYDRAS